MTDTKQGQNWAVYRGDCCELVKQLPDASIDVSIFSPPFSNLYIYSDSIADMGNSTDTAEFLDHYSFLARELLRATVPGRLCIVHCKDLPRYAGRDGTAGLDDFPGDLIRTHSAAGWSYHSRVTIWKCPVVERERTNNNGLLHKTVKRDSSQVRNGMADYVLVFRRPPETGLMSDKPIIRENGFERYVGENDPRKSDFHPSPYARKPAVDSSVAVWQRYADPVWFDIDQTDVLNVRQARDSKDERHICPLQLGLIRRCLHLWSDVGDVVYSPFTGIGSEGVVALQEGRKFIGHELKQAYFDVTCRNLARAEKEASESDLYETVA